MYTKKLLFFKRIFDIFFSASFLIIFFLPLFILWIACFIDTKHNGLFTQKRVGYKGKIFKLFKFRTMKIDKETNTSVTTINDKRITRFGAVLRRYKIDELPQLVNIVLGQMSFVGPRPDIPKYINSIREKDRKIMLSFKPGLTSLATLKYRNEEIILAKHSDPEKYNDEVLFSSKVLLNLKYVNEWSFYKDIVLIIKTVKLLFLN